MMSLKKKKKDSRKNGSLRLGVGQIDDTNSVGRGGISNLDRVVIGGGAGKSIFLKQKHPWSNFLFCRLVVKQFIVAHISRNILGFRVPSLDFYLKLSPRL